MKSLLAELNMRYFNSANGFLVLFAVKKYISFRGRRPRLTADQKAAKNASRRTANTPECAAPLKNRFLGG